MKFTYRIIIFVFAILLGPAAIFGQSSNQDYPTPVTSTEITGAIKARDIGDARLTTYYFQFDGDQGDLFINVVTRNFTGDIDVFTMGTLRPLTKIVVYADLAEHETGRVIYLRKPEKMILRVQGRTPGDDPATFRIKFAGSFLASSLPESTSQPELPSVSAGTQSGIRVNSVGTIVEVIPKATPAPPPPTVTADVEKSEPSKSDPETKETPATDTAAAVEEPAKPKLEVVVTETTPKETTPARPTGRRSARNRRGAPPKETPPETPVADTPTEPTRQGTTTTTKDSEVDPLANINLVISFKDGRQIQRPMSQVLRFSVDRGMLTVIGKDGGVGRYSILDVAKVTIE